MKLSRIVAGLAFTCCLMLWYQVMADDGSPAPIAGPPARSNKAPDLEQSALLKQGLDLAAKGSLQGAIRDCYDPVIAYYERTYNDKRKHYFSARGAAEALLYVVEGANTNTATLVVSRNWVEAHFLKGFALVDLGQLDAARAEYDAALKLAPDNSQVRAEIGSLDNRQRKFDEALESYQRAEEDSQYSPPEAKSLDRIHAYHGLGYAYTELRQWDKADEMYRKALEIDSNDHHALNELQYIQHQRTAQETPTPR